ncbi:MAG TPA: hypothetical protein VF771_16285 [Longimicrobiaceae bacterium]
MKKKLTLKVDALRVEQFEAEQPAAAARGTVLGRDSGLSDAHTDPCRFCPDMPITWSCDLTGCC